MGILFLCLTFMLVGCGKEEPQEAFDTYAKAWNKQNLQKCMINYQKRQKDISKKEFTEKYEKFILALK